MEYTVKKEQNGHNHKQMENSGYKVRCLVMKNEDRMAGCVCYKFVEAKNGILGRRVNSNGQYKEIGNSFALDDATLANWRETGKSNV